MKNETENFCPSSKQDWRKWLELNHKDRDAIWLVVYKKSSKKRNLSWSEAVDQALCFGWIDSVKRSIDSEKYRQYFTKRKATSTWSKINKDKVVYLLRDGLIAEAGKKSIELAKQNGSWTILDEVEALIVPKDLASKFKEFSGSKDYFNSLSKSSKKILLSWIVMAKRPETRAKRILEIVENAGEGQMPKQFIN